MTRVICNYCNKIMNKNDAIEKEEILLIDKDKGFRSGTQEKAVVIKRYYCNKHK